MKIYLGHSRDFDFQKELYDPIRKSDLNSKAHIVLPHEEGAPDFNSKEDLKGFDYMIAEVSYPSTGLGMEIAWADLYGVPIIAFAKKGSKISSSVRRFASQVIEYSSSEELVEGIEKATSK